MTVNYLSPLPLLGLYPWYATDTTIHSNMQTFPKNWPAVDVLFIGVSLSEPHGDRKAFNAMQLTAATVCY